MFNSCHLITQIIVTNWTPKDYKNKNSNYSLLGESKTGITNDMYCTQHDKPTNCVCKIKKHTESQKWNEWHWHDRDRLVDEYWLKNDIWQRPTREWGKEYEVRGPYKDHTTTWPRPHDIPPATPSKFLFFKYCDWSKNQKKSCSRQGRLLFWLDTTEWQNWH